MARGMGPGETIALMSPNIPEFAIVFHGAATAGVAVSTINPTYTAEEVAFQLRDSQSSMLVTIGMFAETATAAAQEAGVSETFIIGDAPEGMQSFTALMGEPAGQVDVDLDEQIVVLPYSSGTTGFPKGVMLSHQNLVANLVQCEDALNVQDGEVVLAVLPFFHIYGMQVLMNFFLSRGATIVTVPRFDLEQSLGLIQEHKITRLFAVPPIVLALAKHQVVDSFDLSSLTQIFSGAAPLGAELAQEASDRISTRWCRLGMTELSPIHVTRMGGFKPAPACHRAEHRVSDRGRGERRRPDRRVVGAWTTGDEGYLNNPEATAYTIDDDGWLHTGDVGFIDEDGHLTIVDRVKELIKFKGFQVAPAELEALLLTHPAIADAAVIGVPDDEAGERPRAFIVLKPGQDASADQITAFTAEHLATYKVVHDIVFTEEIPKSASGKILRRMLRDQ